MYTSGHTHARHGARPIRGALEDDQVEDTAPNALVKDIGRGLDSVHYGRVGVPVERRLRKHARRLCSSSLNRTYGPQNRVGPRRRSDEHTSELQSLMRIAYAVFRLKTNHNTSKPSH